MFFYIQGSVLKETLSQKLLELKELGRLRALKNKWFSPSMKHKEQCDDTNMNGDYLESKFPLRIYINCVNLNSICEGLNLDILGFIVQYLYLYNNFFILW